MHAALKGVRESEFLALKASVLIRYPKLEYAHNTKA
jgi:hypothetical protein